MTATRVLVPLAADDAGGRRRLLALNAAVAHLTSPLDEARLDRLLAWSADLRLLRDGDATAGFVITVPAGSAYDSGNYRAHAARFADFTYLDRIVVDPAHQRRGLASAAYDELEAAAVPTGRLALEVNLRPANEPSLAFHRGRGYRTVGERDAADGTRVALMVRELA